MMQSPKVTLFGAAGEVTGSCTLVESEFSRVLVDFGMFQGAPEQELRNADPPPIDFAKLDAVVLTHAHVDHCGRLGMLSRLGFNGPIIVSDATSEILPRVLRSSATLQFVRVEEHGAGTAPSFEVLEPAHLMQSSRARDVPPVVLFGHRDADRVAKMVRAIPWSAWHELPGGMRVRLHHACHVVGAASVELELEHGGARRRVLCSGDIGPFDNPLLAAHQWPERAPDLVVMECTNGHRSLREKDAVRTFDAVVHDAVANGRRLLFPVFALGRAQQLQQHFARLSRDGALDGFQVYLDSGMAVHGATVLERHPRLLAPGPQRMMLRGESPLEFPQLHRLTSRSQSEDLRSIRGGCAILAGSGFCDAGPILRHLLDHLEDEGTSLVFTGFQLEGSLGRALLEGATRVRVNGHERRVRCRIERVEGVSGHGDREDLLRWFAGFPQRPARVVLNHGIAGARSEFSAALATGGTAVHTPMLGEPISF